MDKIIGVIGRLLGFVFPVFGVLDVEFWGFSKRKGAVQALTRYPPPSPLLISGNVSKKFEV